MEYTQRELLVSRVLAGFTKVRLGGRSYKIHAPQEVHLYEANELYQEVYDQSIAEGSYTDDQLLGFLITQNLWDENKENELKIAEKNIETIKVKMFELNFRSSDREEGRKLLKKTENHLEKLRKERGAYDYLSARYNASMAKERLLIGLNLVLPDGTKYWNSSLGYNEADGLIDKIMAEYYKLTITEQQFRELARTEPWRLTWTTYKTFHPPFPCISPDLKLLAFWSKIYDNINESPDCPEDEIIEDDDLLDGWMIIQRNKRNEASQKNRLEKGISSNDKIKNAQEIYLIGQTAEDRERIHNLNDAQGKMVKMRRMNALKRAGTLHELEMPDTKERLMTEWNQKFIKGVTGGS